MATVARPFAILALGGGITQIGWAVAAQTVPSLVLLLLAGAINDRMPRDRVLLWGNLVEAGSEGVAATLVLTAVGHPWQLIVLAAVRGAGSAFVLPAEKALVAQTVAVVDLGAANALLQGGLQLSKIVSAAAAGVVVGFAGPGWAMVVIAAAFVVAALLRFAMRIPPASRSDQPMQVWRELVESWQEFWVRQWLWVSVLQFCVVVAINTAVMGVLGPLIVAHRAQGPQSWGVVLSAMSVGALTGAVIMARRLPHHPLRTATAMVFVAALPPLGLAGQVSVPVLCAATFAAGMGLTVFGVIWPTTMQRRIPSRMLSRMFAWDAVGTVALAPAAAVLVGPVSNRLGMSTTLLLAAGVIAAATIAALASPQIRGDVADEEQL